MHTFAVVCVRRGRRLPDHTRRILRSTTPAELTFPSADHVHWSDDEGGLHFSGWQLGNEHLGIGSHWEVRRSGVTAFSGHTWLDTEPWEPGASWASQLADRLAGADIRSLTTRLDGVFSLVHLGRDGRGSITSDPLGVGLVYQSRNDDISVFSNRAALAARLSAPEGTEPKRDVEGAVCIAYSNYLQTARTTFAGVTIVPRSSVVELHASANPRVHVLATKPWTDPDQAAARADVAPERIESAVDHLRGLVRVMASLPSPILTMELTGGRDSRMLLALLLAEGVAHRFTFVTWGSPDLPDVVVAGQLADRFDLDLLAEGRKRKQVEWLSEPTPSPGDGSPAEVGELPEPKPLGFESLLRRHVWRTSGAASIWDLSTVSREPAPSIALTGQFGELLRSNYPRTTGLGSMADLDRFVRTGGFGFDGAGLLRPSARRYLDDTVVGLLHELRPPGGTPQDAVDGYYQATRMRTWFGASHEMDNRNRLFPLYSMPATRTAFAMGSERRRLEALPFEVIRATCPELATMPFASSGWPASLVSDLPDREEYPTSPDPQRWVAPTWRQRRALRRPSDTAQAPQRLTVARRRMNDIESKIPVLREFLDLGPTHELYRYLDYDATMTAVNTLGDAHFSGHRSVHDAVTAAMWLGGADTPESF